MILGSLGSYANDHEARAEIELCESIVNRCETYMDEMDLLLDNKDKEIKMLREEVKKDSSDLPEWFWLLIGVSAGILISK